MVDRTLTCKECSESFIWTAGEQEFYASRGLEHPPARCPSCRERRRAGSGGGGRGGFGGGGERRMYSATCSNCGREALVPFQPRGDKPVYCSDCFEKRAARAPRRW